MNLDCAAQWQGRLEVKFGHCPVSGQDAVKIKSALLHTCCRHHQQDGQPAFTGLSDLFCNRLHITVIKQARRQEQRRNSLLYPGHINMDWKSQWLFTKTANVYAIRGIVHHSTLDIPWSTEGWLKMLGSGIVLMVTPKSNLSRHRGKFAGPTGMHQSAEPIKDSFHWPSTQLLTLRLAVCSGGRFACQLLTVWRRFASLITVYPENGTKNIYYVTKWASGHTHDWKSLLVA